MAIKATYIIVLVDYFCITYGLISKTNNIIQVVEWMEIIVRTIAATPLFHVRHRIGYVQGIKVDFGGRKENIPDSENFHTNNIL